MNERGNGRTEGKQKEKADRAIQGGREQGKKGVWVDTHCHLDFPGLTERVEEVVAAMEAGGVVAAITVGTSLEGLERGLAIAERFRCVWATVGVHPDYEGVQEPTVEELVRWAEHPRVVAIGETGLDYFRAQERPRWQEERFRVHVRAARATGLPLVIHSRGAAEETLRILREERAEEVGGVMHCFTESVTVARAALDLGFFVSFSGIVTFKNATAVRETARFVPRDRLLVETDAPFLAPVPHRGKQCEPGFVRYTGEFLAEFLGVAAEELAQETTENACRLFRLPVSG